MTGFRYGAAVSPAAGAVVTRLEGRLRALGVLDAGGEVVIAVGADDPRLAARCGEGPRVVVPALAGRRAPAWSSALLRSARALVLFDAQELTGLPAPPTAPVVLAGLPRPAERDRGAGLDARAAPESLIELWRSEVGGLPDDGPGVAWVGGGVLPALAAAAEAWAERRAVVALPGTRDHEVLRAGGALTARTSLEAVEAARYLCENRPLARALADRGRRRLSRFDALDVVAGRFAEAILLAGDVR